MRAAAVLLVACATPPARPLGNAHRDPVSTTALPCNAASVAELSPYQARSAGACTVGAALEFDYRGGRERRMLFESGRPVMSSSEPPYARMVVFDPRIPTPGRIRVGMTGAELERLHPTADMKCTTNDEEWQGHLLCRLRDDTECAAEDANWFLLVFEPTSTPIATDARGLVRARKIIAIDLGPDCGES